VTVNASPTGYEQKNELAPDASHAPPDSPCNNEMLWANPPRHTARGRASRHSGIRINRQLQVFGITI
jgi:hypothetical protein